MWYDDLRFNMVMNLIDSWDANPIKEAKFLDEITDKIEL
jgi:hypothetical protein